MRVSQTSLFRPFQAAALLLATACWSPSQADPGDPGRADPGRGGAAPAAATKPVVSILGASVSAGFVDPRPAPDGNRNETVDLSRVLKGIFPRDEVEVRQRANVALFMRPEALGERAVARVLKDEPALVVAVDFLFWFGYGPGATNQEVALGRQQAGLALLERIEAPIILGDYPDMAGADPRMIPTSYIPSVDTQRKLNERLRAWAQGRENITLFPLGAWATDVRANGQVIDLEDGARVAGPAALLQGDRLHMNRLGMALLGMKLQDAWRELLGAEHALSSYRRTLDELVEVTRAGPIVAELPDKE